MQKPLPEYRNFNMDALINKDLRHVWHPYTRMKKGEKLPPLVIERAKGIKLYDRDGKFYYDTISSWWCNVHGHNHPRIKAAIRRQLNRLDHVLFAGITHEPAVRLAEKLVAIAPRGLSRVFFSDNGSTAVEVALKMSFQHWQQTGRPEKKKFIRLENAYHGDTVGAMSVSGVGKFNRLFSPLFFPAFRVPSPYCYRCPIKKSPPDCGLACAGPLEELLQKKSTVIAALILEPMLQAAGGMIVHPAAYLKQAALLCRRYGVHLILDEVATGFGRTGRMFACEHAGIRPDFLCLAKGITGGCLPLGATLTTERIFRSFYSGEGSDRTFYHGHTYTANPLACAAALASLEIFRQERTLARVKKLIPVFHAGMEGMRELPLVGDVRCLGMVGALELVKDKRTKQPFAEREEIGRRVYREGLKRNLLLRPLGNAIYLFLPLSIKTAELKDVVRRTREVVEKVEKEVK